MLGTDTEKNSSYGSKPALPRAGEQKKRACEEFRYDFSNGTKRSEARPEETYFYGENQPMMFEEAVKAKNGDGSKNAEKGLAVFLTVTAVLLALVSAFSILTGFGVIKNYTGLFEEATTEAAADAGKGSNYIYNSDVFAETSKSETSSGESLTAGQ